MSALSVLEIYSATINTKFHGFESKQVLWLVGGTAAMLLLSFIDYHVLLDVIHWIYGFCIVSLLVVLVAGQKVLGARRWIRVGGIHFQPSEWVKLVLIVLVARYFANLSGRPLQWNDILKAIALWSPSLCSSSSSSLTSAPPSPTPRSCSSACSSAAST